VSPVLDTAYGAFATRLRSHLFVLRSRPPKTGESPDSAIVSGIVDDRGVLRLASDELPNADAVATSWRLKAAEVITQDLPREVREWVNEAIPAQPLAAKDLAVDRVDLVLWGSQAAHDCATGSNSRCLQALGLTPVADPAFDLFNEDQRHEMIERNANRFRRADPTQYSRCTNDHIQAICDSMAHAIPFDAVAAATPPGTRRSLLRYALKLGGAGSFDRLAAAEGTVAERIAAAANAPIDTVTRRWQQAVAQSGSTSTAIDFQTGASAVFWAAACCALALRSSRWR
jgi:hypothetical protein